MARSHASKSRAVEKPADSFPDKYLTTLLTTLKSLQTGSFSFVVDSAYKTLRDRGIKRKTIEVKLKEITFKPKESKIWTLKPEVAQLLGAPSRSTKQHTRRSGERSQSDILSSIKSDYAPPIEIARNPHLASHWMLHHPAYGQFTKQFPKHIMTRKAVERRAQLEDDPWIAEIIDPYQIRCGGCGGRKKLDSRHGTYSYYNWHHHRKRCVPLFVRWMDQEEPEWEDCVKDGPAKW
ncbi:hypothetical protein CYLTODRAFT_420178 [Cylindrobasidium torrendii FP15055 ss-10]|uniref:Uncharacterized protein n=1 Tax=Cylindrobasidium torrendii FP15055 ss-10 TaxID=1314674 RepID=A0A0D7BK39_9AGAR|nr:hypothetical protein CYLTODRAFT_420178 [Cylindrobasidium torrendii FP15055 ss-10]